MNEVANGNTFSNRTFQLRHFLMRRPEWCVWLLSALVWLFLFVSLSGSPQSGSAAYTTLITYCTPTGPVQLTGHPGYAMDSLTADGLFSKIAATISSGLGYWIIMVIAMMFPLLNEPVRHVARSLRRKDRSFGIAWFLMGYTIIWTMAGILFLLLPLCLSMMFTNAASFLTGLISASGFLLAAFLILHPSRPVKMIKCSQTMPLRIHGWQLHLDSLHYGLRMGLACLNMCWAPMAALMLVHHNIVLMYMATIVLIYERYLLPHTSRIPAYAWGTVFLILFGLELWD